MDRAERKRRTANVVARRVKEMRWDGMFEWIDEQYVGRCRHMSPFDCGRPRCGVCTLLKRRWAGKTRQEKRFDLDEGEF